MGTLRTVLFIIFFLDAFLLVIAILLQSGRGGGLAGALGGISSADSALGVRAASQIEKATGILAAIFLATALLLAFIAAPKGVGPTEVPIEERLTGPTTRPAAKRLAPTTDPKTAKPSSPPAAAAKK